jgi:hypothetical protein
VSRVKVVFAPSASFCRTARTATTFYLQAHSPDRPISWLQAGHVAGHHMRFRYWSI